MDFITLAADDTKPVALRLSTSAYPYGDGVALIFRGGNAEPVERIRQVFGYRRRVAPFDLMAFQHVHELTVLENSNRRRRREVSLEVAARPRRRFDVGACEDGHDFVWYIRMFQRRSDGRPRQSVCAPADRMHHDQDRALSVTDHVVDCFRRASLFDAEARQILAHGFDEHFLVWHEASLARGPASVFALTGRSPRLTKLAERSTFVAC